MIQEEIARLTGKLVFQVDNRPLATFEKRLNSVYDALGRFQSLANKKVTMKVDLDGRSLRAKVQQASSMRIKLSNVMVDNAALVEQGRKVQDFFAKTPIRLQNVKVEISGLVEQKKFVRTMLGQMQANLRIAINQKQIESELNTAIRLAVAGNPIKLKVKVNDQGLVGEVRRAIRLAERSIGAIKVRLHSPQLQLQVDRRHLQDQIRAIVSGVEYQIRVRVTNPQGGPLGAPRGSGGGAAGSHVGAGLAGGAMGFARGAIPGLGAAFAFAQMNKLNQEMMGQTMALTAITGSESGAAEQKQWLETLADRIGLDVRTTLPAYSKMLSSGTTVGMSTESVQNIFQGVSEYGRVMGLDKDTMKGSMRAIEQMMNKGQVMSEELKGQLAERMPGAISAMAEAAGFGSDPESVQKLFDAMKKGEVKSAKVLEKFAGILAKRARDGGALEKALNSTAAQQARFNNSWTKAVEIFSQAGFDRGMGSFFRTMADGLKDATPLIKALGSAFDTLVQPINAVIRVLGDLGRNWDKIAAAIGLTGDELAMLATMIGVVMLPFGGLIAAIGTAALLIDDFLTYLRGGKSVFGDWLKSNEAAQTAMDSVVFAMDGLMAAWDDLKEAFSGTENPFKDWSIDGALIQSLTYIEALIRGITQMISAVAALKNGDFWEAGKLAGGGAMDLLKKHPLSLMHEKVVGGLYDAGQDLLIDQRARHSPTQAPPGQAATNTVNNNTPVAIYMTLHPPQGSAIEPEQMQNWVQDATKQALRDAFGQMRAQQAEK